MANQTVLVNYFDCDQQRKGTGTPSCEVPTGVPTGFFLVDKSWRIDTTVDVFNQAYITTKIKEGVFTPFLDAINFTDNSEESVLFTTQLGVKLSARDGKPEFMFDYSNGYCFHSAAWSYNSFGNYDVILTYDNGVMFLAKTINSELKGHTAGLVNTDNFKHKDGSESEKTAITIQLLNAREYNIDGALLDPTANAFDIDSVKGIVDVTLEIESATFNTPNTDIIYTATASCNNAVNILGIDVTELRILGNTAAAAIVTNTYDSATNKYTLVVDADVSSDYPATLKVQLYDVANSLEVAEIPAASGLLFQGTSA